MVAHWYLIFIHLSPDILVPCFLLVWRIGIWVMGLELCSVDFDSSGLGPVDSESLWLVIILKSKDRSVERPPMKTLQP
jgi:hypothetical protein